MSIFHPFAARRKRKSLQQPTIEIHNPVPEPPILPYKSPLPNSGWAGSDTSFARAVSRDKSGATATMQDQVLKLVDSNGLMGVTVAEARNLLSNEHHGTISGTLSNLHKAGQLARLSEKRGGCKVYVTPSNVRGRPTEPQGFRRDESP